MRLALSAITLVTLLAVSCNNEPKQTASTTTTTTATPPVPRKPASALNEKGTSDLTSLLAAYYELKDAMVATDTSKADIAASHVLSAAETMKNTLNADSAHTALLPHIDNILKNSDAINADKQSDIEKKRASFEKISDAMYALLKDAKMSNAGVYHQYCPMAFNDKGAYWLSNEEEIKNPYFGKKMLECGEVKDSL